MWRRVIERSYGEYLLRLRLSVTNGERREYAREENTKRMLRHSSGHEQCFVTGKQSKRFTHFLNVSVKYLICLRENSGNSLYVPVPFVII